MKRRRRISKPKREFQVGGESLVGCQDPAEKRIGIATEKRVGSFSSGASL